MSINKIIERASKYRTEPPPTLPFQFDKLGKYCSIPRGTYCCVTGMAGSGKSAFVNQAMIIDMYDWWKKSKSKLNLYWILRSMERPLVYAKAKFMCYKLFKDHNILIDLPTFFNWPNKVRDLTDDDIDLMKTYTDYFDEFYNYVNVIGGPCNPTGILMDAKRFAETKGKIEKIKHQNIEMNVYHPNNPNDIVIHITDHLQKLKREKGLNSRKEVIDAHIDNMTAVLRDKFGWICIDVAQMNRNIRDPYRKKSGDIDIEESDIKDSSNPYEMADLVFGLISPSKLRMMKYPTNGYDINKFQEKGYNRFRGLKIVKSTYGGDDMNFGFQFYGECGLFKELPAPDEINYFKL